MIEKLNKIRNNADAIMYFAVCGAIGIFLFWLVYIQEIIDTGLDNPISVCISFILMVISIVADLVILLPKANKLYKDAETLRRDNFKSPYTIDLYKKELPIFKKFVDELYDNKDVPVSIKKSLKDMTDSFGL